jgi:hypothetical protein
VADGHLWRFDVAKNFSDETAGDEVIVEVTGIEGVPEEAQIYLVDRKLDQLLDLREESRYRFFQGRREFVTRDEDARFLLLVGSEDFVAGHGEDLPKLPTQTVLHQNYPNPFNPSTIIRYELAQPGHVEIRIYDVTGALVKILESRERQPGRYEVGWSAENERGERVASGVYFYRLRTSDVMQTRKMLLLKYPEEATGHERGFQSSRFVYAGNGVTGLNGQVDTCHESLSVDVRGRYRVCLRGIRTTGDRRIGHAPGLRVRVHRILRG